MAKTVHGTVHGKSIQFSEDLGIPDGEKVDVIVIPSEKEQPWGEGIARSAGIANDIPEFDQVFEQIERDRKAATFRKTEE
jgi:hypothetical protein